MEFFSGWNEKIRLKHFCVCHIVLNKYSFFIFPLISITEWTGQFNLEREWIKSFSFQIAPPLDTIRSCVCLGWGWRGNLQGFWATGQETTTGWFRRDSATSPDTVRAILESCADIPDGRSLLRGISVAPHRGCGIGNAYPMAMSGLQALTVLFCSLSAPHSSQLRLNAVFTPLHVVPPDLILLILPPPTSCKNVGHCYLLVPFNAYNRNSVSWSLQNLPFWISRINSRDQKNGTITEFALAFQL